MLVQVAGVFAQPILERPADADEVDHCQMLNIFAKSDAARVWTDGNAKLCRQQQHCQDFVHAAESTAIDLANSDRTRLEKLFEQNSIRTMLARGDFDRCDCLCDRQMSEDIVGTGRFFDEPRLEFGQRLHPFDRLGNLPDLICIDHQSPFPSDLFANNSTAADVVVQIATDLDLEHIPTLGKTLLAEFSQFFVVVSQPASRCRVGGIAIAFELCNPRRLRQFDPSQQLDGLFRCKYVGQIPKIDATHKLFGRQVGHQKPQWLLFHLGPQVPDRVNDRSGGQVDDALVGAYPSQLTVPGDLSPESRHIVGTGFQRAPHNQRRQSPDRGNAQFVAASDRECHAMSCETVGSIGLKHDIRGGVVGVGVHRIRAVERPRRRKSNVMSGQSRDSGGHSRSAGLSGIPECVRFWKNPSGKVHYDLSRREIRFGGCFRHRVKTGVTPGHELPLQPFQSLRSPTSGKLSQIRNLCADCAASRLPKFSKVPNQIWRIAMDYDLLVVGNEREGIERAIAAAQDGLRVAIIENSESNPSVDVMQSAANQIVERRDVTMSCWRAEVSRLVRCQRLADRAEWECLGIERISGSARFLSAGSIEVTTADDRRIVSAAEVVLACGTESRVPKSFCVDERFVLTVESLLKMEEIPRSAIIVGAGETGLSAAMMLATLGVDVVVIDEQVNLMEIYGTFGLSAEATECLNIAFRLGDEAIGTELRPDFQAGVRLASGRVLVADAVLICVGRDGNTGGFNLEAAGVGVDEHSRVWCDNSGQTWNAGINAVGTVIGFPRKSVQLPSRAQQSGPASVGQSYMSIA